MKGRGHVKARSIRSDVCLIEYLNGVMNRVSKISVFMREVEAFVKFGCQERRATSAKVVAVVSVVDLCFW
jgi:hypothetical protein